MNFFQDKVSVLQFLPLEDIMTFAAINSWAEFEAALAPLGKKAKGDAFEELTYWFFRLNEVHASQYEQVWLWALKEEGSIGNDASAVVSVVLGLALNELYWRPFNQNRMQGEVLQSAMKKNSDADFYSFPLG